MDYVRLGKTGLRVSRICLGCMTFGDPVRGAHPWTLNEDAARPIIARALDAGITFFDTANGYPPGRPKKSSAERCAARSLVTMRWSQRRCSRVSAPARTAQDCPARRS